MPTIRRLYLYAVAFISLEVIIWGLIGLGRTMAAENGFGVEAASLAEGLALLLVGLPAFGLHWWLAQRGAAELVEERSSRIRAVFLYGALLATLIPVAQNLLAFADRLLLEAFGAGAQWALFGGGQSVLDNLIAAAANALAAGYLFLVTRAEWGRQLQGQAFPETRRLYRYAWLIYSLGLIVAGAALVLILPIDLYTAVGGERLASLANGLALSVLGWPLWYFTSRRIRASLREPAERESMLRLGVLYALTLAGALGGLLSAGRALNVLALAAMGAPLSTPQILERTGEPLAAGLALGAVWLVYGRRLRGEIEAIPEAPRRAALRRFYFYALSLVGLGAAVYGLNALLSQGLAALLGGSAENASLNRARLASGISAALLGIPVWVLAWLPMVREAAQDGESGDYARRSLVRRAYLFLVIFAGVLGIMAGAGNLVFQALQALLGEAPQGYPLSAWQVGATLVLFLIVLVYHGRVLRVDVRRAALSLARRHAQFPVLVLAPEEEAFAATLAEALEREAPELPVAVQPISAGAPDETQSAASAVILPSALLAAPPEALRLWLADFSGARVVIPTEAEGWHWLGGGSRELAGHAGRAARVVRRMAEGEELSPPLEGSLWMTVIYVLAGLAALQLALVIVAVVAALVFG